MIFFRKHRRRPEEAVHVAVIEHLRLRAKPDVLWLHVPNGEHRTKIAGARLKALGLLPGAADLLLFHRGNFFALELKAPGGRLSEAQRVFFARFSAAGGHTAVAEGLNRALSVLEGWGLLLRGRTT